MRNMTASHMAEACQGKLIFPEQETFANGHSREDYRKLEVTGVVTDNRQVEKDNLFIPFVGEKVDAHRFIPQAFEAGAAIVLSQQELENPAGPYILVESTEQALKDIAAYYRSQLTIPVVGIIGSVGKTSTKEMVASVLSQKYDVLKTEANFNNEIGMPQTLLKIRDHHKVAVIEMGIDHLEEMSRLGAVARPDMVVMTNIGQCHLEYLRTRDGVLAAKTEVFNFLQKNGVVVLNGDDDHLCTVTKAGDSDAKVIFFGLGQDASSEMKEPEESRKALNAEIADHLKAAAERDGLDASKQAGQVEEAFSATSITPLGIEGVRADYVTPQGTFTANIPIPGQHNVYNALAAAAIGTELGLTNEEIKNGMETAATISGRVNFLHFGNVTVIDDCYNANPASMKASLSVLAKAEGRTIAVLGDMGELGSDERALHYGVGVKAAEERIHVLFTAGELSKEIAKGAADEEMSDMIIRSFDSRDKMVKALLKEVLPGDTILVKASHFMEFPEVVEALREALAK